MSLDPSKLMCDAASELPEELQEQISKETQAQIQYDKERDEIINMVLTEAQKFA